MKLLVFSLVILFFVKVNSEKCDQLIYKVSECMRKITYLDSRKIEIINNEKELNQHCAEAKEAVKCVKSFSKCLTKFPKQVFSVFFRELRGMVKNRCDQRSGRREFLKHVSCLDEGKLPEVKFCSNQAIANLDGALKKAKKDELIPALCCSLQILSKCVDNKAKKLCINKTGPETAEYLKNLLNSLFGDVVELACGERKSVEDCQRIEPKWMKLFSETKFNASVIKDGDYGMFPIVIRLAKKLDA